MFRFFYFLYLGQPFCPSRSGTGELLLELFLQVESDKGDVIKLSCGVLAIHSVLALLC